MITCIFICLLNHFIREQDSYWSCHKRVMEHVENLNRILGSRLFLPPPPLGKWRLVPPFGAISPLFAHNGALPQTLTSSPQAAQRGSRLVKALPFFFFFPFNSIFRIRRWCDKRRVSGPWSIQHCQPCQAGAEQERSRSSFVCPGNAAAASRTPAARPRRPPVCRWGEPPAGCLPPESFRKDYSP